MDPSTYAHQNFVVPQMEGYKPFTPFDPRMVQAPEHMMAPSSFSTQHFAQPQHPLFYMHNAYQGLPNGSFAQAAPLQLPMHYSVPYHRADMRELEAEQEPAKSKRKNFPREVTLILSDWFLQHVTHPYPSESDASELAQATGLTPHQVNSW